MRLAIYLPLVLLAAGCGPLDDAESVGAAVSRLAFVHRVDHVLSERDCTAARLSMASPELRSTGGAVTVTHVRDGLPHLQAGRAVAFAVPGATPNAVSEQLMSMRLFQGLGLLGSFLGPGRRCMDDAMVRDAWAALMSPDAVLVYDPATFAVLILHAPSRQALYLRTGG